MRRNRTTRYFISITTDYREDEYYVYKYFEAKGVVVNCKHDESNSKLLVIFDSLEDVLKAFSNILVPKVPIPRALRLDNDVDEGGSSPLFVPQTLEKHLTSILKVLRRREVLYRVEKEVTKKLMRNANLENNIRRKLIEYILSQFADDEVTVVYDSREKVIMYTRTLGGKERLERLDIERYFDNRIFTYRCPVCGEMFDQLADLRLHYVRRHDASVCPLDSNPADLHMCDDFEHCAYGFLTFFSFNDPLLSDELFELYKIAYLCARYTFNVKDEFYKVDRK